MRIGIIEDMTLDAHHLMTLLRHYFKNHPQCDESEGCEISVFSNLETFQQSFEQLTYSLLFLDIFISPKENGYQIAQRIRRGSCNSDVPIIFTTSSRDYAVESYDVEASGYLLKPVEPEALNRCMDRFFGTGSGSEASLTVIHNRRPVELPLDRIMYIISDAHGSDIYTANGVMHTTMTVEALAHSIISDAFVITKRGYMVNMAHIIRVEDHAFIMEDGKRIPLKVKQSRSLIDLFAEFQLKH